MRITARLEESEDCEAFFRALDRYGRARTRVVCQIFDAKGVGGVFHGTYAAVNG